MRPAAAIFLLYAWVLCGCAVGPNFYPPSVPQVDRITAAPLSVRRQSPRFVTGSVSSDWWVVFGSAPLNELVSDALTANPDLAASRAALRVARANADAERAAFFPSLSAGFNATRQKQSDALSTVLSSSTETFNLFTPQLTISYEPDLFGGTRRATEAADAAARSQLFSLRAAHLTLAGNVAVAAIQYAALSDEIVSQRALLADAKRLRDGLSDQLAHGAASQAALAAQETVLLQQSTALITLQKQQALQLNLLAALTGRVPAQFVPPHLSLAELSMPHDLPISLPADLVRQRPDVRIAEENLHAANAQVGVAIAAMLPNITISGSNGSAASALSALFGPANGFWSVGVGVLQPLFDGGALLAKKRAADAALDQAKAQYQSAVVAAFHNTADALEAVQFDEEVVSKTIEQEKAASISLARATRQRDLGDTGLSSLLLAQQAYQQSEMGLVQAKANQLADTVGLFASLGGGWWRSEKEEGHSK